MNPFHIRVEKFDYSLPGGRIIPAAQLQEMVHSRDLLSDARQQAAEIVHAAGAERDALLAQAQRQADKLIHQARHAMETDILAQHVAWLVAAEQAESSLVTQAREQILAAITVVVTTWAGQQPVNQILIDRLGAQVEKMAHHNELVLRVHPQHLPAVVAALGARVQCVADENMAQDQAQLSSPLLQLTLSLHHHLSQLILWLHERQPHQDVTDDQY
ncbi:type III secretion apparatus protein, HrpE/YscL family [Yersinia frederiksenii]|uniref:Type III secretion apparatus protein, HrpE/YscL family n=2 Tax=Yersinia frederiksenii TaxID=29484 RepID=A0A380PYH6_YERFR|nr:type III secretion system stator protein SctL [Yersinia frederiksenii]ATM97532.1 HrpE/YscL family type III secretion apparatus protein [Yersinia frederiksenii]KGA46230.1 type III secretion apparatus protein, HrpE/YscL family [Yersinia frederiksenii ATCC 33641]MDN0120480.1 type III secretion system stator protein SctL [Yersinia frederiksenii]CFR00563.1 type III secretion apparatus protein%2C HrpE/YscL family [Yersinia frederiksenii]SUP78047.1 type III secretion apparatus protein, HrpE/YscL f